MTLLRKYIFFILISGLPFLSYQAVSAQESPSLTSVWGAFLQQATQLPAHTRISLEALNRYPTSLLLSQSQYPNFEQVSWQQLKQLHDIKTKCPSIGQTSASNPLTTFGLRNASPSLEKGIAFELALCHQQSLPKEWFLQGDLLHPAGGSYADRYSATLQGEEKTAFIEQYSTQFTLSSPEHPLHSDLSSLSYAGRDALLSQYRAYLMPNGDLWLNTQSSMIAITSEEYSPLLSSLNITLNHSNTSNCAFLYSNMCVKAVETNHHVMWFSFFFGVLMVGFLFSTIIQRRKEAQERKFILQFLTHELRTPIASLGFTVEQFRQQFDDMSDASQKTFWRLLADHQRLSQLAETSKGFLSTDHHTQFRPQTAYLSDWLDHCLEKHNICYQLTHDKEVTLPFYWLGICLDNLIKNAQQHGMGRITVSITVSSTLYIEVKDEGHHPHQWQLWLKRLIPTKNHLNMGIGLTIVAQLMKKMGGTYRYHRHPTRCILELPL